MKIFTVSVVFESSEVYATLTHTRSFSSYGKAFSYMKDKYNDRIHYYENSLEHTFPLCFFESNINDMNARIYFLPYGKNYEDDYRLIAFTIKETELEE